MMSDRKISALEVSTHCSEDDAWIVLNGAVWDVSGFAAKHPGGSDVIEEHFGLDGSEAYNSIHSPGLIQKHLGSERQIGTLEAEDSKSAENISSSVQKTEVPVPDLDSIISIHEFAEVAATALRPRSFEYIRGSTENGLTKAANADWYRRIWFRPRVLTGVREVDLSTTILGQKYASPIFNAPTSSVKLAHPDGELAWARALSACGNTIIIPTLSSYPVEEIIGALPKGHPFFFQLYVHTDRAEMNKLLDTVCRFRPQAIIVTVDLPVMTKRENYEKYLVRTRQRKAKKTTRLPLPSTRPDPAVDPDLQWKDIRSIQERTGVPVFVKGVQCAADALRAYELGCAGIYISNHGGRALDTASPSILTLLEIQASCPEILDRLEVFIDGGIQRGTDILKAICLGASAVCLGRPFLFALAYGEEGMKHAIKSKFHRSKTRESSR